MHAEWEKKQQSQHASNKRRRTKGPDAAEAAELRAAQDLKKSVEAEAADAASSRAQQAMKERLADQRAAEDRVADQAEEAPVLREGLPPARVRVDRGRIVGQGALQLRPAVGDEGERVRKEEDVGVALLGQLGGVVLGDARLLVEERHVGRRERRRELELLVQQIELQRALLLVQPLLLLAFLWLLSGHR